MWHTFFLKSYFEYFSKQINVLNTLFTAALNLAKLKLFRHFYVMVSQALAFSDVNFSHVDPENCSTHYLELDFSSHAAFCCNNLQWVIYWGCISQLVIITEEGLSLLILSIIQCMYRNTVVWHLRFFYACLVVKSSLDWSSPGFFFL